eukprot:3094333-Prymnesium_polylepis.3
MAPSPMGGRISCRCVCPARAPARAGANASAWHLGGPLARVTSAALNRAVAAAATVASLVGSPAAQ